MQHEQRASDKLLMMLYDELKHLAARKISKEKPNQTLSATALVHEVYLRLLKSPGQNHWESEGHYFGAAAEAMRRILVEAARKKQSLKGGGQFQRIELDSLKEDFNCNASDWSAEILDLDGALSNLAEEFPEAAELVTLSYFGGQTVQAAAEIMGVSERTAHRHWNFAKAVLFKSIYGSRDLTT